MNTKTLSLLFLRKGNRLLLAMKKRGFGEGRWNGVGGKVEDDESIESAMIRESKEEIGVTPTKYEKVGDISFDEFFKGEPTIMHVHIFMASQWQGEPIESEEMAPKWFNIDDIPYDAMWPDDIYWLPQVLDGKKVSAQFKLDETATIRSYDVVEVEGFAP